MRADREKLDALLEEIRTLVEENDNGDGTFRFDVVRAAVALDFARTEIEKTIRYYSQKTEK